MAGIGFELRKILKNDSYSSITRAYVYAGLISSGPWVLSIVSVFLIGVISYGQITRSGDLTYFYVTVTYLMCSSLILTGGLQLMFTRFVADRVFENKESQVLPNLFGCLVLTSIIAFCVGFVAVVSLFPGQSVLFKIEVLGTFVALNNLWIVVIFLAGMKAYNQILLTMFVGYATIVLVVFAWPTTTLESLMGAFFLGHCLLLFSFLFMVIRHYKSDRFLLFDFLKLENIHISLVFIGLFYYLDIWIDKIIFWFNPATSDATAGLLRSSVVYDMPIFLAYLTIIPGMAVFLVRFETDFAESYQDFYRSIREGDPLETIHFYKGEMVAAIRLGLIEIFKIQTLALVILLLWAKELLIWLGISPYYRTLLEVDMIGVSVQVLLLAILSTLFYLDRRLEALQIAVLFFLGNCLFSLLSQYLGPAFFGYGFAMAATLAVVVGLWMLNNILSALEYETFMLQ